MKVNDAEAFHDMGAHYFNGRSGLLKNRRKAFELSNRAAELGSVKAHYNIALDYHMGQSVDKDIEKAVHHYKLATIGGHEGSRYALGLIEEQNGNMDKAMKHHMIGAKSGSVVSLKRVGHGYKNGYVTKDEYTSILRAYQYSVNEMKSDDE